MQAVFTGGLHKGQMQDKKASTFPSTSLLSLATKALLLTVACLQDCATKRNHFLNLHFVNSDFCVYMYV